MPVGFDWCPKAVMNNGKNESASTVKHRVSRQCTALPETTETNFEHQNDIEASDWFCAEMKASIEAMLLGSRSLAISCFFL